MHKNTYNRVFDVADHDSAVKMKIFTELDL